MQRLFIASSGEAYRRGITRDFATELAAELTDIFVEPWEERFKESGTTLNNLLRAARNCQFVVLLFMKDDDATVRDVPMKITRDNVVFEAGLFISQLPLSRVALVCEKGVKMPSDLAGVVPYELEIRDTLPQKHAIRDVVRQIADHWTRHPDLSKVGLQETLGTSQSHIAAMRNRLVAGVDIASSAPFVFDALWCEYGYAEAMENVQTRFWTTTFLTSEFWKEHRVGKVLESNKKMLMRLQKVKGSARRIFVLPSPPARFFATQQLDIEKYRATGQMDEVASYLRLIGLHRKNIETLESRGCEIKMAYDAGNRLRRLLVPDLWKYYEDGGDEELAIFDSFRVDLYSGGTLGVTNRLVAFAEQAYLGFDGVLSSAEDYFQSLWDEGIPATEFLAAWEREIDSARYRIDYVPNWPIEIRPSAGR